MTEFKRLQIQLKLTNEDAAQLFKKSERTITRWRDNEAPESVLMVLRLKAKS